MSRFVVHHEISFANWRYFLGDKSSVLINTNPLKSGKIFHTLTSPFCKTSIFIYILVIFVTLPIFAQNPEFKSAGDLRKIMLDADLSTKIRLDTLPRQNLFAIGIVDGLQG